MCGVAGVIRPTPGSPLDLERLAHALSHRGPDDVGFLSWDGRSDVLTGKTDRSDGQTLVGFAHRRLSVLDLGDGGWQPMVSHDGTCFLAFNGEIYNYIELREELTRLGHRFRSHSDTEVLLAAWQQWRHDCLSRIVGMFAFAVLDTVAREVLLVRDAFGIKPLFYVPGDAETWFGSEIPPLLAASGVRRTVDPVAIADYLRLGLTDYSDRTCFAAVRSLHPGEVLRLPLAGRASTHQWYRPDMSLLDIGFDEAALELRDRFVESVRLHLRSDRRLGTALSGGIDSSAVIGVARAVAGDDAELHAFSYLAENAQLSEKRWVDIAGRAAGAVVHPVSAGARDLVEHLDCLVDTQGEPFGSTSIFAQHQVFRQAHAAGVTVMLDGQGADELLAGYPSLIPARCTSLLREGRLTAAVSLARAAGRRGQLPTGWHLSRAFAALLPANAVRSVRRGLRDELVPPWLNADWFSRSGVPMEVGGGQWRSRSLHEALDLARERTSLPALLRFEDRNSMAFSIESRVPFLDHRVVEFTRRLPEEYLIAGDGTTKAVFRAAMRGLVPDQILDRRDKIGFETPEREWLTTLRPWVEETLSGDAAKQVGPVDAHEVAAEYGAVLAGRRPFGLHLWRCINLVRWSERMGVVWA